MNEGNFTEDKTTGAQRRFEISSASPAGQTGENATYIFDLDHNELEALPGAWRNVYQSARDLFFQKLDWIKFFAAVLGPEGMVRQTLKSDEEVAAFRESPAYAAVQQMVGVLRAHEGEINSKEPLKVITVRVPKSLHESLRHEAHRRRTSMNQLCILKLLQEVETSSFERLAHGGTADE